MESFVDDKDHNRPAHNALNTDTVKKAETDEEASERRMQEVANKAAGKALKREHHDDAGVISNSAGRDAH